MRFVLSSSDSICVVIIPYYSNFNISKGATRHLTPRGDTLHFSWSSSHLTFQAQADIKVHLEKSNFYQLKLSSERSWCICWQVSDCQITSAGIKMFILTQIFRKSLTF